MAGTELLIALWQIVVVDVLLSGDNAVVIALACRNLPEKHRNIAVLAGTGGAVAARLVFCFMISTLLGIPALKLVGGVLLLWIGIKLMAQQEEEESDIKSADGLWQAVRTIVIADLVMSLDNVIGIVAAAKGHFGLIAFGLCLSIPLIVFGSKLVLAMLKRVPSLVTAGAALLGWLGGEIMAHDPIVKQAFPAFNDHEPTVRFAAMFGAAVVVGVGTWMRRRQVAVPKPATATVEELGPVD